VLAVALFAEGRGHSRRRRGGSPAEAFLAALFILAVTASVGAIALSMYLMASPVGSDALYGLQPRYLLAHVLLLLGAFAGLLRPRLGSAELPPRLSWSLTGLLAVLVTGLALSTSLDLVHRYF
jgi:hypothetical protein